MVDGSFDGNRSRPQTAGNELVFTFAASFVQFVFFGVLMGPGTALTVFGVLMIAVWALIEVNFMLSRREAKKVSSVTNNDVRKVGAVVGSAIFAAYALQAAAFPQARLGVGRALLVLLAALVVLGVINNWSNLRHRRRSD